MSDLKDFLENIRKVSARIGEVAMRHVNSILLFNTNIKPCNFFLIIINISTVDI